MNFEKFETEFLIELSKDNKKKCLKLIDDNVKLINENIGENGNSDTIKKFVKEMNNSIVKTKKKFSLFEKVLAHPSFNKVSKAINISDVLIEACKLGNKEAAKWLLTMDIDTCIQDEDGMTALMYACKNSSLLSIVKKLVLNAKSLNILDKNGNNALFHALSNNDALCELLRTSINVNHVNNKNETVLIHCCKNDIFEPIDVLTLSNDINVNITDDDHRTAAMYLAEKARSIELKQLNKRNCNYDFVNKKGESVLSITIQNLYSSNDEKVSGEFIKYLRILTVLIHFNCSFDLPVDSDENTAIMVFLLVNDLTTLSYVLKYSKNYDLSVKNKFGENASSLAMKMKNNLIYIKKIFSHSTFDKSYIDSYNNNTMLMISAMNDSLFLDVLIEDDINTLNSVNFKDENALILATKIENEVSVKKLLKHKINVNQQDILGNTSLYYAVDLKNKTIIKELVLSNADANIKNKEGISALNLAHEIGDKEILNILLNPESYNPSENEDSSKKDQTNKYSDIYEYLYPWINNSYTGFKMTKSLLSIQKCYFMELQIKMDDPSSLYRYNNYYPCYGYYRDPVMARCIRSK